VNKGSPDIPRAKGLIKNGIEDIEELVNSMELNKRTSSILFKIVYDGLRSVLQAFLTEKGYRPYSHEAIIAFNLENGNISKSEASKLDNFRHLRNDIEYRAERATEQETEDLLALANVIIARLKDKI
tara:strand:- start:36 stop:416 length:381 start_codon:yes stop_codon:yes gene_type:complete